MPKNVLSSSKGAFHLEVLLRLLTARVASLIQVMSMALVRRLITSTEISLMRLGLAWSKILQLPSINPSLVCKILLSNSMNAFSQMWPLISLTRMLLFLLRWQYQIRRSSTHRLAFGVQSCSQSLILELINLPLGSRPSTFQYRKMSLGRWTLVMNISLCF